MLEAVSNQTLFYCFKENVLNANVSFSVAADGISLFTQKLCMCCVTSSDIDLDNIEPEKME